MKCFITARGIYTRFMFSGRYLKTKCAERI